jgi:hypothetical protein
MRQSKVTDRKHPVPAEVDKLIGTAQGSRNEACDRYTATNAARAIRRTRRIPLSGKRHGTPHRRKNRPRSAK